ncbi:putative exonuclease GOR [Caerostris extrusa]|uniref:Exonuclease GOR n=1 Tax=Caerostris extrusa TaxID=172846 RepID=A0AAV4MYS5_CAEEX|nr:putative exonuclease GOR [Caerostris extrusa]
MYSKLKEYSEIQARKHQKKDLQNGIYALDCEMSYTTSGLEVTKVGVVNAQGLTVYETYVRPNARVLDYNTRFSGITAKDLAGVTTTLLDVKARLMQLFDSNTILIGHAINNDLEALGLLHKRIIDTSVLYPNPVNPLQKKSLRSLAAEYLAASIQDDSQGHDCIEDCRATMQLALLKVKQQGVLRPNNRLRLSGVRNQGCTNVCMNYTNLRT